MVLICAEMIQGLTKGYIDLPFFHWIIIMGIIMLPLSWFGSPADFWPVALFAMGGTAIASVLITYAIITFEETHHSDPSMVERKIPTARSAFVAMGTIIFGYGGASALPTFQNDMREKKKFSAAVALAFLREFAYFWLILL